MAQYIELPARLHVGDTLTRTLCLPEHVASSGWVAKLTFANGDSTHTVTGTAGSDGDSHVLAITTRELGAGAYRFGLTVEDSDNRLTLQTGRIELLPNFADGPADHRSHVEKTLEALEAMLEGKASKDQMSLTVEGQAIGRTDPLVLLKWRDQYRAELHVLLRRQRGWRDRPRKLYRL